MSGAVSSIGWLSFCIVLSSPLPASRAHQASSRYTLGMVSARWARIAAISCSAGREKRSEEHTSELQSLIRISYAVFCLNKKNILYFFIIFFLLLFFFLFFYISFFFFHTTILFLIYYTLYHIICILSLTISLLLFLLLIAPFVLFFYFFLLLFFLL